MPDQTLIPRLNCLRDIFPPSHITLIGAGNGSGGWAQWLLQNDSPALLLEADPTQYRLLEQRLANQSVHQHHAEHALVAPEKGDTNFYAISLTTESGLLPAENLSSLWPNLQTVQEHTLAAVTLHDTLVQHGIHTDNAHLWLFVDCLPAAPLLTSAGASLQHVDVVAARVVLPQETNHIRIDGAGLNDLKQLLHGMRQIALQSTRHPAIAYVLFVRDYRAALLHQTQSALVAQSELQHKLDETAQARHGLETNLAQQHEVAQALQTKLKAEVQTKSALQHKLDESTQAQQELQASLTLQRNTTQALQTELEGETQIKIDLQRELEQATQAHQKLQTTLTQQLQALQTALEDETQARADLQHELDNTTQIQHTLKENLAQQLNATQILQAKLETKIRANADLQKKYEQTIQANQNLEKDLAQKSELTLLLKAQSDTLTSMRTSLAADIKKEAINTTKQIGAFLSLQNYFSTGELPSINVERHNFPVSHDFAFYMVTLLNRNDYDLVVEFGSGISSVIIARTLTNIAVRRDNRTAVKFVSFEHLEHYYQQTRDQLAQFNLQKKVQLYYTPLRDWQAPDGNMQPYYACQSVLAELAKKYCNRDARILAIVDGPPQSTGTHARYPAGPLMLENFADATIDLLLDDYRREDEKEIVQMWLHDIVAAKLTYNMTKLTFEKDACLISIRKDTNK